MEVFDIHVVDYASICIRNNVRTFISFSDIAVEQASRNNNEMKDNNEKKKNSHQHLSGDAITRISELMLKSDINT